MNASDLDQATDETIRGNEGSAHQSACENHEVTAALNLVSETAAAIKAFEEQATQALGCVDSYLIHRTIAAIVTTAR